PSEPASIISCTSDPKETSRWSLAEIDVGPEYEAAVAVEGDGWRLKCWHWNEYLGAGGGDLSQPRSLSAAGRDMHMAVVAAPSYFAKRSSPKKP
ncbi:MAG TPA: hypothetical protein VLX11_06710, partial [Candidatus Acidoferrales bacterium]|nr:hypothetical protein [Candidatus Acidoferrales bacterium]